MLEIHQMLCVNLTIDLGEIIGLEINHEQFNTPYLFYVQLINQNKEPLTELLSFERGENNLIRVELPFQVIRDSNELNLHIRVASLHPGDGKMIKLFGSLNLMTVQDLFQGEKKIVFYYASKSENGYF